MKTGAQLYTVRDYIQTEKDFAYTVKKIAEIGYTTLQISAIGKNISASKIREICDTYGMKIVLTHSNIDRILYDTDALIEEHEIMGCNYIGIGCMPEKYRSEHWIPHFAEDFSEPARKIAAAGKLLMYHNHHFEFEKFHGKYMLDYLLEAFSPNELGITLDTYWVQAAGGDVCQWIDKLKDRIPCVHLKDMSVEQSAPRMAPVMEGNMNFHAILKALEKSCCNYLLVEQDVCQTSPFTCLKQSYDNLSAIGYR